MCVYRKATANTAQKTPVGSSVKWWINTGHMHACGSHACM